MDAYEVDDTAQEAKDRWSKVELVKSTSSLEQGAQPMSDRWFLVSAERLHRQVYGQPQAAICDDCMALLQFNAPLATE